MPRKNRPALPFLVLIVAALLLIPATASAWSGKVVHVTDGDTITVIKDGQRVRIRLYGIDTPESDQPFGSRAERFTAKTIGNNRVEIVPKDKDRYGRTVAPVYIEGDGECLNEELVRPGFAWVYDRYCRIRDCNAWEDLESQARESEIRLWQQASPIPPRKWRHSKQKKEPARIFPEGSRKTQRGLVKTGIPYRIFCHRKFSLPSARPICAPVRRQTTSFPAHCTMTIECQECDSRAKEDCQIQC